MPSATATRTATPTPSPTPNVAAALTITGEVARSSSFSNYHYVYARVFNGGSVPAYDVRATITYFDAGGTVMGVGSGYTSMSMLRPGESSTLLALTDVQPGWSRYELSLSADRSSYITYVHEGLEFSGLNTYRSGSTVYVVGLMRNNTGRTVKFPEVGVTLFGPTGSLVDYSSTYPFSSNDVAPGASSAFSVPFFDSDRSIPSGYTYVIDAEAWLTTSLARAAAE